MEISECRFGRLVIDGVAYERDLIIHGGRVYPNWWRREGHSLCIEDLSIVLDDPPQILVIGRGHMSVMQIPDATRAYLAERGIELIGLSTPQAVERFTVLLSQGRRVSAGFHLTC